jgi:[glutamine synthetase] adenylyltransferase / [glutamine synthetase]-adenylyl-L-tyrosine phosphorylase
MRLRMQRELSKAGTGQFDIKQDAGGIADIEFLVQYWVLAAANTHPDLLAHTDNIRQLESLEGQGERVVEAAPYASSRERVIRIWRETFEED